MPQDLSSSTADRLAIQAIAHRLALATDEGEWTKFLACFVPDATADYGTLGDGPIEQLANAIRESQARYQGTMNVVGTHAARIEGDRAQAKTYVVSHHFRSEGDQSWDDEAGTQYVDDLVRTAEGWRIERRIAKLLWFRSLASASGWI
jgi:hypothetical protein